MTTTENRAEQQAKAQMASIALMIQHLEHASDCGWKQDGDECEADESDIRESLGIYETRPLTDDDMQAYHDQDAAMQDITDDPLSIQVRSDWTDPGETLEPAEYNILLCTGGPACRIVGDLDKDGEPTSARLQYQDWGTPWTELVAVDHTTLLTYARQFFYGS